MKKNALSTSLRSATQATDSTRNGCNPKNIATIRLRQVAPVIRFNTTKASIVLAAWSNTLVRWCPQGAKPNSWQSNMCESQVIGCQLAACELQKAHSRFSQVSPCCTRRFAVTYSGSSKPTKPLPVAGKNAQSTSAKSKTHSRSASRWRKKPGKESTIAERKPWFGAGASFTTILDMKSSLRILRGSQYHVKSAAPAGGALDPNPAPMRDRNLPGDG